MTTEQKIIRAKVGLLELAKQLGNGSPTRPISIHHPQRKLHEVLYAPYVGIPKFLVPPPAFGIATRFTACGR